MVQHDNANATTSLFNALRDVLSQSAVRTLRIATGYFQLPIWEALIRGISLADFRCFLLIGMLHRTEEAEALLDSLANGSPPTKLSFEARKQKVMEILRRQLEEGLPNSASEHALEGRTATWAKVALC